jgi:hypothetical protein
MSLGPDAERTRDLCMRSYGHMRPVDEAYWGTVPEFRYASDPDTWLSLARSAGLGWAHVPVYWNAIQPDGPTSFDFTQLDTELAYVRDSAGCEMFADVQLCPAWASSRLEDTVWSHYCPPRNLFLCVDDTFNYWARFIDTLVRRCGDGVHYWQIWNEPNDTLNIPDTSTGWFRHPDDSIHSTDSFPGLRGLCALYVRMVEVAAAAIRSVSGHSSDVVVMGGFFRSKAVDSRYLVSGADWLETCYDIAGSNVTWDAVSVHPYQDWLQGFDASLYQDDADTLRAIMRNRDDGDAELWNTEFGWSSTVCSEHQFAANMLEMYVCSKGSEVLPQGGYDGACWFYFWRPAWWRNWGLADSAGTPTAGFYTFRQMTRHLTGKRFNRRVMQGGAKDDSVRVYEFEDPATLRRTWVCWKNGGMDSAVRVEVRIPVMTDRLTAESLAYRDGEPPCLAVRPEADGWLSLSLDERPVYISELDTPKRPDLVVDSVRVAPANPKVGESLTVRVWVRNQGTRATPRGYATRVLFTADGDSIGGAEVTRGIAVGQAVLVEFRLGQIPSGMFGPALFATTVNPDQRYVELDMYNNTGYTQAVIE